MGIIFKVLTYWRHCRSQHYSSVVCVTHTCTIHCNICIPSSFQCLRTYTHTHTHNNNIVILNWLHRNKAYNGHHKYVFTYASAQSLAGRWHEELDATLIAKCSISTNCTHHIMQKTRSFVLQCMSLTSDDYITERNYTI